MWLNLAKAVHELQRTYGEAFNAYRPELHYMRGPGPKWHAKRPGLPPAAATVAADAGRALAEIAGVHALPSRR
jgi:hypothetical protein